MAALVVAAGLSGCGRKVKDAATAVPAAAVAAPAADAAAAAAPAASVPAAVDCKPAPPADGKGPDVMGIRLGDSAASVRDRLNCLHVNFTEEAPLSGSPQYIAMNGGYPVHRMIGDNGAVQISVVFEGESGDERVVGVEQIQAFAAGEQPLQSETIAQIEKKYGKLRNDDPNWKPGMGYMAGNIDVGPQLRGASPDFAIRRCLRTWYNFSGEIVSYRGPLFDCGKTIAARVSGVQGNPDLVSSFAVVLDDGFYAKSRLQAYADKVNAASEAERVRQSQQAAGRKPVL